MSDWDAGSYERTAERLQPVADVVVTGLAPAGRVLDVACGTGNAALAAARRGYAATGADSAERLIAVARTRARNEGLDVRFDVADATALPYPDRAFDAVVSVFGVIFTAPADGVAELLRVARPGAPVVFTTWRPGGVAGRFMEIVGEALGTPPAPPRWSSEDFVRNLFAGHRISFADHSLPFRAPSPEAYVAEQLEHHPLWQDARTALVEAGRLDEVVERINGEVAAANEDPSAFLTTSRYRVVTVTA